MVASAIYHSRHSFAMGLGVYAGREIESGETVEVAIGIPIPLSAIYWTELVNYSEGYNDTHALFTLGNSALYNHVPNPDHEMIRKFMSHRDGIYEFRAPFERSIDVDFVCKRDIDTGEQMFAHYGNDWFENRGWTELEPTSIAGTDFPTVPGKLPGCTYRNTLLQNNILVAKRMLLAGEVIEVVRALLIPDWAVIEDSPLVDLLWWPAAEASDATRECQVEGSDVQCIGTFERSKQRRRELRPSLGSPYRVAPWNRTSASYAVLVTGHGAL
jgi:hypothetical protein